MLNTKTLEKIRQLRADAYKLAGFHQMFATKYGSDERCDKKGYGFGEDHRFSAFSVKTSFDSWTGYYGNSSCGSALGMGDEAAKYIVKAMNIHQKELFATAARLMREDASKLTGEAEAELSQLQQMLSDAQADEPAVQNVA